MQYLLDSANVDEIAKAFDTFPMSGVTTNPTIVSMEKRDFFAIMHDIRAIIGPDTMLHAQVLGESYDEILADAEALRTKVGGNIYIKIPVTFAGYKAMKELKKRHFQITATAIFTPAQALLASNCGADYTAPYINRIDNISGMGVAVVRMITELYKVHSMQTKVLAASFKNVQQVHEVSLVGCQAVTVPPDILWKIASHPLTDAGVSSFIRDWNAVYGEGTKVADLEGHI